MTATLADFWHVLCPALPAAWHTAVNTESLARMTQRMAPIPRIGLECMLGNSAPRLDLQQCIRRTDGEADALRDFMLAAQPTTLDGVGVWARLQRFCTAWADPTTLLHRGIFEVFLEYDVGTADHPALSPSLFFAVDEPRAAVAREALALLLPSPWPGGLAENLERCLATCPSGAGVDYVGVMLGRAAPGVRFNVKRLGLGDIVPYLRAIGWEGSLSAVETWAAWAYDRVDRVTLCIDVGARIPPHIGLECSLNFQPPAEPRWHELLEELSGAGLCTPENAGAFLGMPGVLCPADAHVDWPATWVAASLQAPADRFSTTERRLSHLKLTVTEQDVSLKGYLGAGHVWRTPGAPHVADVDARSRPVGTAPATRSVAQALERAIAFLVDQQAHTGRWSDFLLPAGPSDEWVTAFVGACLLETPAKEARLAAERAWQALISRQRDEAGWGYNRLTPADADSTAWALRLAAQLNIAQAERVDAARHFLADHQVVGGGITTYANADPIRRYTRLPEDASLAGWRSAHTCVTAAAAPEVGKAAARYLARQQAATGDWQGYWWWDDEYTTALAADTLASRRATALAWAQTRVDSSGAVQSTDGQLSPWATAWCVRILCLGTTPETRAACTLAMRWLVGSQQRDGSWRASARLRVPMPGQVDAVGGPGVINAVDQHRVFTTAAVAAALSLGGGHVDPGRP